MILLSHKLFLFPTLLVPSRRELPASLRLPPDKERINVNLANAKTKVDAMKA